MSTKDLYDYYLDGDGNLNRWMRSGNNPVNPTAPGAPTAVDVSVVTTVATLTWAPPTRDGGSPITGYTVIRVGGATHSKASTDRSDTFTGLTVGVLYTFTVAAVNAVGTGPAITVTGSSSSIRTVWGINNNNSHYDSSITGRKAYLDGRFPVLRVYDNPWPKNNLVTYDPNTGSEGRCVYSWKGGDGTTTWSQTQLGNGSAFAAMKHFYESIPAFEQVWVGFHHEVNGESPPYMEVTPATYLAIYHQMRLALTASSLATGVEVIICCNYMFGASLADGKPNWDDAWVPPRYDPNTGLGDCDCWTADCYGNPRPSTGPNKYGGWPASLGVQQGLDCDYPLISGTLGVGRLGFMLQVIQRTGYADSWGIWEFNSPQRSFDAPASAGGNVASHEIGRKQWHNDYISVLQGHHGMTGGKPARIGLFWEENAKAMGVGAQDQRYGRLMVPATQPFTNDYTNIGPILKPLILSTPKRRP